MRSRRWQALLTAAWLGMMSGGAYAQESSTRPATQPATRVAPSHQERIGDLIALIEGQNAPEVRRIAARELLLQGWPETPPRIAAILAGVNAPAKIALATALSELPDRLEAAYIDSLVGMLADPEPTVRDAAAGALAAYPDGRVIPRLRLIVYNVDQPRVARIAAITALGLMTEREAVAVLVHVLSDPDASVAAAALAAVSRATAIDFNDDPGAAWSWWEENSGISREAWQQRQIGRLVRKDREMRRRLETLESRLTKVLETSFLRAPDAERATLLAGYLADPTPTVRILGLRLAQQHLAEGRALSPELQDRVREQTASLEWREQAAAIRTVASFREPRDAARFIDMLRVAHSREVRLALLNALGHVGSGGATPVLLEMLEEPDEQYVTEAVAALGRMAERNVLDADQRDAVADRLVALWSASRSEQTGLRERVLWALGNLADPRAARAFAAGLQGSEGVAVRQAAVRGIALLKAPQLADALAVAVTDPDPGVRRVVVETLAALGSTEAHLQALWERLTAPQEADDGVRVAALRGVVDIVTKLSAEVADRWLARLPRGTGPERQRGLELLERLVRQCAEAEPVDRARLGLLRSWLAGWYADLERPAEAITCYLEALGSLEAIQSDARARIALELFGYALAMQRYDDAVAAAVGAALDGDHRTAAWELVRNLVERRLTREGVDQAVAMLTALDRNPPWAWAAGPQDGLRELRDRAAQLKQLAADGSTTQPDRPRG